VELQSPDVDNPALDGSDFVTIQDSRLCMTGFIPGIAIRSAQHIKNASTLMFDKVVEPIELQIRSCKLQSEQLSTHLLLVLCSDVSPWT